MLIEINNCFFFTYRHCQKVQHISDLTKDFTNTTDNAQLRKAAATMQEQLDRLLCSGEANIRLLHTGRHAVVEERQRLRKRINEVLDKLDERDIQELDNTVTKLQKSLINDIEMCKKEKLELRRFIDSNADQDDAALSFTSATACRSRIAAADEVCRDVVARGQISLEFKVNDSLDKFLGSLKSLGSIFTRVEVHPNYVFKVREITNHCLDIQHDQPIKWIQSICEIADGMIVASCYHDSLSTLALLDQTLATLARVDVRGDVRNVCHTTGNEVVISAGSELQLFTIERTSVKKMFSTVGKFSFKKTKMIKLDHFCTGLAFQSGQLYVSSGEALFVYKMDGRVIRTLYDDSATLSSVNKCAVSADGSTVYVTNWHNGSLVTLDNQGNKLATLDDDDINKPTGVHVTPSGHVFVACLDSGTILQISQDGKCKLATLAQSSDGLSRPRCVLYHQRTKRLLVGGSDLTITELHIA